MAEYPSLERDVPRILAEILRKKVKKITIVEPDKVATWVEAHPHWTEPADAARDFGADIAIFLEVEQFQSQSPGDLNMVHGDSKVHIQVFELDYPKNSRDRPIKDQPKEAHNIYDGYAESTFPNRGPLPIDSGNEPKCVQAHVPEDRRQGDLLALRARIARKTRSRIRGSRSDRAAGEARLEASPPPRLTGRFFRDLAGIRHAGTKSFRDG